MIYVIDLLNDEDLEYVNDLYDHSDFSNGLYGGKLNNDVKNTNELVGFEYKTLREYIASRLQQSSEYKNITSSKYFDGFIFSKYESGMHYSVHNDNYVAGRIRTDFSNTIFLNSPDEYQGGELMLRVGNQDLLYKLKAGQCIIYPTGLVHEVKPIASGVRRVCIFWTESEIGDATARHIMGDFNSLWSKYSDDLYKKVGDDFAIQLQNIRFRLMRKYGNFS